MFSAQFWKRLAHRYRFRIALAVAAVLWLGTVIVSMRYKAIL